MADDLLARESASSAAASQDDFSSMQAEAADSDAQSLRSSSADVDELDEDFEGRLESGRVQKGHGEVAGRLHFRIPASFT